MPLGSLEVCVSAWLWRRRGLVAGLTFRSPIDGCPNESRKQRVRLERFALEFGVELNSYKPGMVWDLDDFDQAAVGTGARESQAIRLKLLAILIVEFVPVAMSLINVLGIVRLARDAVGIQHRGLGPQSHCATHLRHILLFIKQADHWVFRVFVEFA